MQQIQDNQENREDSSPSVYLSQLNNIIESMETFQNENELPTNYLRSSNNLLHTFFASYLKSLQQLSRIFSLCLKSKELSTIKKILELWVEVNKYMSECHQCLNDLPRIYHELAIIQAERSSVTQHASIPSSLPLPTKSLTSVFSMIKPSSNSTPNMEEDDTSFHRLSDADIEQPGY